MKSIKFLVAFCLVLILSACGNPLPQPKNENGTVNPTVAVGELEVAYSDATTYAASYATTCHKDMTTVGCSQRIIDQLKTLSDKALAAVFAAETAVRKLPAGATTGAETPINAATAAINDLKTTTPKH